MVQINTQQDFEQALERLRQRESDTLAAFVLSLAADSGPVGDQVRTFIAGDNLIETVESVTDRIRGLALSSEYDHRHSRGREMGVRLDFIVDSVERLVLAKCPRAAFELLIAMFEADKVAIENCGEYDWEVTCAYRRATEVMAAAAKHLPRSEVEERVKGLINEDGYGVRAQLASAFASP
jgi:hypothetical protein